MRRERLLLCFSLCANVALVVAFLDLKGKWKLAESQVGAERRQSEKLVQLAKEIESAAKSRGEIRPALTDAEVLELARLRNEVTRLRNEQKAVALSNSTAARRPPTPQPTPLPPAQSVTKLTSTVSVQVPLGHALALGGWAGSEPGQRIVGFITPSTDASAPGQVLLQTQLVSVPDRLLDRLGLQDLRTDQAASQSSAGLDPAKLAALLKLGEQETGVSILSAPRVITNNGQAAQVSVTQTQPDGTQTGPALKLTPTLDASGTSVQLDVGLELNLPAKP